MRTAFGAGMLAALAPSFGSAREPPKSVFMPADDLGHADLDDRGGKTATPNIDKLATDGARLEPFYGMRVGRLGTTGHSRPSGSV